MKRVILLLYIMVVMACVQQQADSPVHFPVSEKGYDSTAPQPRIKLSDTIINLGTIKPDTIYEIPIVIENVGEKPLIIKRAFSDCGCVVSNIPDKDLHPEEVDTLKIMLNTSELPLEAKERIVTIVTNTIPNHLNITIKFLVKDSNNVLP